MDEKSKLILINNIPPEYHSSDLRNFFSQFIESQGFVCFHFRHRPETQKSHLEIGLVQPHTTTGVQKTNEKIIPCIRKKTMCCIAKLKCERYNEFQKRYHKQHWLDRKGSSIPALCYISPVNIADYEEGSQNQSSSKSKYLTRKEQREIPADREIFTQKDLDSLPELNPPINVMPNGNVGTPTKVFLELIAQCKLPPSVIKKLGIVFPKSRSRRRYGCVPFDYMGPIDSCDEDDTIGVNSRDTGASSSTSSFNSSDILVESAKGHTIERETQYVNRTEQADLKAKLCDEASDSEINHSGDESEEDADECEEWERHEALQDDPTNVERNKERLFEEKIELKWEKGGSGLVFYTDAQYWKQQEGDFDEQTADDWDVDMSVYYEENGGDKDARDSVTMRQEMRRRNGEEDTSMMTAGFMRKRKVDGDTADEKAGEMGSFEKHTKGIGRKILERQGWKDGEGLGSSQTGIADALDNDGQVPSDKRGIGYYGEKLQRINVGASIAKKRKEFVISTVYDEPAETDPVEPLLRRNSHHHIKHRSKQQT